VSGLMEVLGDISTLISLGQDVAGIFGGATTTPSLQDVEAELTTEVATVFFGAELQQEVIDAASHLQNARDFFARNYLNAQNNHQTAAQLWDLLNSPETPGLSDLNTVALTVDGWLSAANDQPAPKDLISTAMSVCMGVYLHTCLFYRERASNATASDISLTETANKRSYAQAAVQKMQARVMNRIANRIACLAYIPEQIGDRFAGVFQGFKITDSWFAGGSDYLQSNVIKLLHDQPTPTPGWDPATLVNRVLHAYRRLLWSGADADYNELLAAINDPGMGTFVPNTTDFDRSVPNAFIANSLPGVLAFGQWAASARDVLMSLDVMVMGSPGHPQDDWHRCAQCGALYFETGLPDDGAKRCALGGQHVSTAGSDYVLHSVADPSTVPAGMQSGWCYCPKCHVLFYKAGSLSVCAAGGAHDPYSSGNYFLGLTNVPTELGITAEQAWLFCGACSALHSYKNGVSVCPGMGGGPHQPGSANYWLSSLGSSA
jgi:hypothetical protein